MPLKKYGVLKGTALGHLRHSDDMTLSRFVAICIILLSFVSVRGEAALSAAATSQETTGSISGRVITEKEGAAGITVLLLRAIPGTYPKPATQVRRRMTGRCALARITRGHMNGSFLIKTRVALWRR